MLAVGSDHFFPGLATVQEWFILHW